MFSYLDIKFPTLSIPLTRAYSLTSSHARYEHELMEVRFIDWNVGYDSISAGTPVSIQIKGLGSSRNFHGYVHHITPDLSSSKNYVDVTFIGASYVFKQQSQKVWRNTTADQVIADIAKSNNFSYVSVPHGRVYDQVSQASMSDWELMVRLAKQSGYSLKADNTTLLFQPLTQDFTDLRQEAAYYAMTGLNQAATGIYSFKPMIGESIPYADAMKSTVAVTGVGRDSKNTHSQTNQKTPTSTRKTYTAPIFDAYHTDVVAPTADIAKYEATAADERNRYAYRGVVEVPGNPTILPDSPIYLDGLGPTYSGYWIALSVEHDVLGNKEYTTKITVGSDSLGSASPWTDNKNIIAPSQSIKRVITPGIRQQNLAPKTTLSKVGAVTKESSKSHFSKAKNVAKASQPTAPSYTWVGSGKNLKAPTVVEASMPQIVINKIRNSRG